MNKEKKELLTTTYSMWSLFRNCRKACQYRYLDNLVPLQKAQALFFGSVIHECLEIWHKTYDFELVVQHINEIYSHQTYDSSQKKDLYLALAMMQGYIKKYRSDQENFQVIGLEQKFEGNIKNPGTGSFSKSFKLSGKVDGIIKNKNGDHYLLEHKTASVIDGNYLEKLWTDFQITLYCWYVREVLEVPVLGVIYNILGKVKLKQSEGETDSEYEARCQFLIAKSKTGKTTAKRKMPETDEAYQDRLSVKYDNPEIFQRETILISQDRYLQLQEELWKLTKAFLEARRTNNFYRNTAYCFQWHRPCAYYPICSAGNNCQNVIDNNYEIVKPHEELKDDKNITTDLQF